MPNGPGRVRSAKAQRTPLVTLVKPAAKTPKMTCTMHMPVTRLHVHNGG